MKQQYKSGAVAAAPALPAAPSVGNPSEGDVAFGTPATVIGAYAFYQIFKELEAVVEAGGLVPDASNLTQVRDALNVLIAAADVTYASDPEAIAGVLRTKAINPANLKAAIDALVDSAPGALDTLNELAAALGDNPNFAATVNAALAARARLAGATFSGALRAPTPPSDADDTRVATTEWVNDNAGGIGSASFFSLAADQALQSGSWSENVVSGQHAAQATGRIVGILVSVGMTVGHGAGSPFGRLTIGGETKAQWTNETGIWTRQLFLHKPESANQVSYGFDALGGAPAPVRYAYAGSSILVFDLPPSARAGILAADLPAVAADTDFLSVTITPRSADAMIKLNIFQRAPAHLSVAHHNADLVLRRGNVPLVSAQGPAVLQPNEYPSNFEDWVDAPATTDPVTYSLRWTAGPLAIGQGSYILAQEL